MRFYTGAEIRAKLTKKLGASGKPGAVPILLPLLESKHDCERRAAAEALVQLGCVGAVEPLAAIFNDPRYEHLRERAAVALHSLGWRPPDVSSRVRLAMWSGFAADAVKEGPEGVPVLVAFLGHKRFGKSAADVLIQIGNDAVPALVECACEPYRSWEDRIEIMRLLAQFGDPRAAIAGDPRAATAVELLVARLVWPFPSEAPEALDLIDPHWRRFEAAKQHVAKSLAVLENEHYYPLSGPGCVAETTLELFADAQAVDQLAELFRKGAIWGSLPKILERLGWLPESASDRALVALVKGDWAEASLLAASGAALPERILTWLREGCVSIEFSGCNSSWKDQPQEIKAVTWLRNHIGASFDCKYEAVHYLCHLLDRHMAAIPADDLVDAVGVLLKQLTSALPRLDDPSTRDIHYLPIIIGTLPKTFVQIGGRLTTEELTVLSSLRDCIYLSTVVRQFGYGDVAEAMIEARIDCSEIKRLARQELLRRGLSV